MSYSVVLSTIGRRFNREWIFRDIDYTFSSGEAYAITGANGSGKSTLLQVIAGSLSPSEGTVAYNANGQLVERDQHFRHLSYAAPYIDLIGEYTLPEQIAFHFSFKDYRNGLTAEAVTELLELPQRKALRDFSSGMKQRVKLALAFCTDAAVLLLDEPSSNLDTAGIAWYHNMAGTFCSDRITIIGSNQPHEYSFCSQMLSVEQYKK